MRISNFLQPFSGNDDFRRLGHYIDEVAMGFSGRIDTDNYNTFLQESVELLRNAIEIFCAGYFDAAYYLVRSSIEVSTVGVYFSDSQNEEKEEHKSCWRKLEYFPVQKKLLKKMRSEGSAFSEFSEKVPSFFTAIERHSESANKIIHKQGYQSFYCIRNHPLLKKRYSRDELMADFTDYLRNALGVVAMMRLAIDPFPVLLTDEECRNRFAVSVTRPYSGEFVSECIGEEMLAQYKTTDFYRGVKQWVVDSFPVMSDAAYDAQQVGFIDICQKDILLEDIHLVSKYSACAILLFFMFYEVCNIYVFGGLEWYFSNRYESLPSTSRTDLYNQVQESGKDNYKYESERMFCDRDTLEETTTFLTARSIAGEDFLLETVSPLADAQIALLDASSKELDRLYARVTAGEASLVEVKSTDTYRRIREFDCDKGEVLQVAQQRGTLALPKE